MTSGGAPTVDGLRRALAGHAPRASMADLQAAVAAVLRDASDGAELLFIKRSEHPDDPWSGHMALPGGRVDPGDAGPLAAAKRETAEEIGLDLDAAATLIGRLSTVGVVARGRRLPMVIEPFVFELPGDQPRLELNHEVDEALWIPVGWFARRENRSTYLWRGAGVPIPLPCYRWEGRLIWGLTLKMVDELLRLTRR